MKLIVFLFFAFGLIPAGHAQDANPLQKLIEAQLSAASPGTRFGIVVSDPDGREVISINPEGRFIPASNTKMLTTAAAYWSLTGINQPDTVGGATVALRKRDVILTGFGDARMSSAPGCAEDCLATLADAIAAKTGHVNDVIGDATLWPDQRWSPGMSWNNVAERSGTGICALSVDSNEIALTVTPAAVGAPPAISFASDYFTIDNRATTVASGTTTIDVTRLPFERTVRVIGQIAVGARNEVIALGIDDPAHYAAWRLAALLKDRRVRVKGTVRSRYEKGQLDAMSDPLAKLTPPPLAADIVIINKVSQNLHADLLLRRVGNGLDGGLVVIERMLSAAGVKRAHYDFADGSGMSTYNRLAPRGTVMFLRWVAIQPWGGAWRASLPVGGVDGTIARRFTGTPLEGRIFAKTGSLNASSALSGTMIAASGRTLTFATFANDIPEGGNASRAVDAALIAIAASN